MLQQFLVGSSKSMAQFQAPVEDTIRALTKLLKHRVRNHDDIKLSILSNKRLDKVYTLRTRRWRSSKRLAGLVRKHTFSDSTNSTGLVMGKW
jgi:hypothetical protein